MKHAWCVPFALGLVLGPQGGTAGETETVTVMASRMGEPAMDQAVDLADALQDGEDLRVLAVAGAGPVQTLTDLFKLKGIDAAIIPADAIAFAAREGLMADAAQRVSYLAKTGASDIIVVTTRNFARIEDLRGRRVNIGGAGDARYVSGQTIFAALGITFVAVESAEDAALAALKRGEVDAVVLAGSRPAGLADPALKALAIPMTPALEAIYAPRMLTADDYPGLIGKADAIETLTVANVVAVLNWKPGSPRHKALKAFTAALYADAPLLQLGARRADWAEVNLAAAVPGLARSGLTADWLENNQETAVAGLAPETAKEEFRAFMTASNEPAPANASEEAALFARFLAWRKTQGAE